MSASLPPHSVSITPGGFLASLAPRLARCGITRSRPSSPGDEGEVRVSRGTADPTALAARERLERAVVAAVILGASMVLTATAPVDGDFWWSDSPRHALNGAFIKDFVAAMPWHDPKAWAINYYLQYPSLTILIYPPLFYVFEAAGSATWSRRRPSVCLRYCSGRPPIVLLASAFPGG